MVKIPEIFACGAEMFIFTPSEILDVMRLGRSVVVSTVRVPTEGRRALEIQLNKKGARHAIFLQRRPCYRWPKIGLKIIHFSTYRHIFS